ncbi:hypothetical protein HPB48_018002 [Haemaphysalis longicornis]|uniref:Uncharacterized protein n=1 Tax=Haemaphysalis longicornis TaxID=44386 RepID=A0A9J6F838_HAELO|nr:hypothetical protein HPB48_018002 [Haemaphysalis longicornis]
MQAGVCSAKPVLLEYFKCGLEFNRALKKVNRGQHPYKVRRAYSRKKDKRGSRKRPKPIVVPRGAFRKPLRVNENEEVCL